MSLGIAAETRTLAGVINCVFGGLGSVFAVLPTNLPAGFVLEQFDRVPCGAQSVAKKIKTVTEVVCRVVKGGAGSQKKGADAESVVFDVLKEVFEEVWTQQAQWTGDGLAKMDFKTKNHYVELKAGDRAKLRSGQGKKYAKTNLPTILLKLTCPKSAKRF
jgi:hypothetical protein